MKKHLIAAAVAGAFAVPAMAQVTVAGVVDVGYVTKENSVAGGAKIKSADLAAGQSTTRIIFRGEEDLGGGLKALFVQEFGVDSTNNNNPGFGFNSNRENYIGVSGSFGRIIAGRNYSPAFRAAAALDPFGSANTGSYSGDGVQPFMSSSNETYTIRLDDSIVYTAPVMGGLGVSLAFGSSTSDNSTLAGKTQTGDILGVGINFDAGPLAVRIAYQTLDTETQAAAAVAGTCTAASTPVGCSNGTAAVANSGSDRTEQVYGASYNLGMARVFAAGQKLTIKNALGGAKTGGNEHIQLGVSVPMGALTLLAVMNDGEINGTNGVKTHDSEGTMIGATYALSKRTNAYFYLGSGERKPVTGAKTDYDTMALGLRHQF